MSSTSWPADHPDHTRENVGISSLICTSYIISFFFVRFVLKTLVRLHEELSSLIILCNGPKKNLCDIEMWSWEYLPRNLLVRMQITNQLTCQDGRTFVLVLIKIRVINSVTKLNRLNFYPNCKSEIVTSESHNRETLIPLQELP